MRSRNARVDSRGSARGTGVGRQLVVGVRSEVEPVVQGGPERVDAVQVQRQPGAQAAERPGQLRAVGGEVRQLGRPEVLQVRCRAGGVGLPQPRAVAHEEHPGAERQEQALVRVEDQGVGALDAAQSPPPALGELEAAAVRAVSRSSRATSAIAGNGSTAPVSVVPAVAVTRNGCRPAARSAVTASRNAAASTRSSVSIGTTLTAAWGNAR